MKSILVLLTYIQMCAKTMLNMEITQVQMSDSIPNAVSILWINYAVAAFY